MDLRLPGCISNKFKVFCFLIGLLNLLTTAAHSQETNNVKIRIGNLEYQARYIGNNSVKLQNFQKIFDFKYETGNNVSSIKINGLKYDDGLSFFKGSYFAPVDKFLSFFLVDYNVSSGNYYKLKNKGIFDLKEAKTEQALVAPGKIGSDEMSVLKLRDLRFVEAKRFSLFTKKRLIVDGREGTVIYDGKPIARWIKYNENIYLYKEDLEAACGYEIGIGKIEKIVENPDIIAARERANTIKNNIRASFIRQDQFGTGNPNSPIGYRIRVRIYNDSYEPIKVESKYFAIVSRTGEIEYGNILGISGYLFSDSIYNNRFTYPGGSYVAYFTIQKRDYSDIAVDFFPSREFDPVIFLFEFDGVEMIKTNIKRSFIPQ